MHPKLISTQGAILENEGKLWIINSAFSDDKEIIIELVPYTEVEEEPLLEEHNENKDSKK